MRARATLGGEGIEVGGGEAGGAVGGVGVVTEAAALGLLGRGGEGGGGGDGGLELGGGVRGRCVALGGAVLVHQVIVLRLEIQRLSLRCASLHLCFSLSLTLTRNVGSKSNRDVGNGKRNEVTSPEAETC